MGRGQGTAPAAADFRIPSDRWSRGQAARDSLSEPKGNKLELNLAPLADEAAAGIRSKLVALFGAPVADIYPNISFAAINELWDTLSIALLEPFGAIRRGPWKKLAG